MIKLLFLDVDGTLTDGKIYMSADGEILKAFNVKDGCGICDILPQYDIVPVIITARKSDIVLRRCRELRIRHVYQNCRNKKEKMLEVADSLGIKPTNEGILPSTAYMGDDILDLPCMEIAEYKGCPADAVDKVKEIADFVAENIGGNGAVREFITWLVR